MVPIKIPTLVGGVSRAAQSQRPPHVVEESDNTVLSVQEGTQNRAGTEFILGSQANGSLNVTSPTNAKHVGWIDRNAGEQFVYLVDPGQADSSGAVVEVFNLGGTKQTVSYGASNPRPYIIAGSGDPRRRLRSLSIADNTFFLNKTVITALAGSGITYVANGTDLRNRANANNLPSWSDFPHPPSGTVTPGDVNDNNLYYAREDDVGHPQGFYAAISTTAPPWYERRRTEGANSLVSDSTMPVRMSYNGSVFTVSRVAWTDRLAGDSALNPGPTFIGGTLSDMTLHQGRMFFASGERLCSSQASDLFNLWINSSTLQVDSDPVDVRIGNNRVSNIEHLIAFRESLMMNTSGGRQYELRADGPLTPSTSRLDPTTSYQSVPYAQPVAMGDQVYFAGERNFSNTIYEYGLSPTSVTNVAVEITSGAEGYLPAEISLMEPSESHDILFVLTDAEKNCIYLYKTTYNGDQKVLSSWCKWITDVGNDILSCKVFGEYLYLLIRRNGLIWLEKVAVERPADDAISNLSMGYAVRLDRKLLSLGVYDALTDTTTWTLPFEDLTMTEIVLGPEWDVDFGGAEQRLKGTRLVPTVALDSGTTVLTVQGQYRTNIAGTTSEAYIGRPYTMRVRLSEQFYRDQNGVAQKGNTKLLRATVRHKNSGYYAVVVTPVSGPVRKYEFLYPRVVSTPFDSESLDAHGEFSFPVLASAHNVTIDIINNSPMPCTLVDVEFTARFVPQRGSPTK